MTVPMIATAIITAPRPRPTINASIRSIREAGFHNGLHVHSDDPELRRPIDLKEAGVTMHANAKPLGNLRNWASALRNLYTNTECDWLMVCEDDITWASGSAEALRNELRSMPTWPSFKVVGALSLYLPVRMTKHIEHRNGRLPPGWHFDGLQYGKSTWGAQCMLFHRSQADALLFDDQFIAFLEDQRWTKNIDAIVGRCINDRSKVIAYRVPCLVNHDLGEANSSLGYKDDRPELRTNYYTGRP